ncbi:putative acetyltransferase [Knoellia remsis]|uniref:Putative acetyltransferase n=1 Tax=Knoellia remsis TaxID=407159 RepID=A0A2T0UHS7_9MICO|nr:N-acetyltransferase [Knoellia remsis]PRY57499.1 putative acetyltransferase [Knoellia remsis]
MRDDLIIRRERAEDHASIAAVIDDAFPRVEGAARSVESGLVDELRGDGDVIDELSFVAELDGEIVGQVTCSRATLGEAPSVGLGPIAVRSDLQQQGIGAALMASVIASADQRGDAEIVLLGDPEYYGHFGFVPASGLGIESPGPWEDRYFQVKTLRAWRPERAGAFRYAPAFERLED